MVAKESPDALYERAVQGALPTDALWQIEGGRTFFAGPLFYNGSHEHGAPVYLAGLYGAFGLRINGGAWHTVRSAMIPAGVSHELHVGGNPIAVLYAEPELGGASALGSLVRSADEVDGCLMGTSADYADCADLRDVYESRDGRRLVGEVLQEMIVVGMGKARRQVDPRIGRAMSLLSAPVEKMGSVRGVAEAVGLSPSRFQHLFTREVGVPFRRYRAWQRMRSAIGSIVDGYTFSRSAHEAGFSDQAHFAHDFKRTFGAPAGISLSRVRA
jgi:AraC-like DNA-binding protein